MAPQNNQKSGPGPPRAGGSGRRDRKWRAFTLGFLTASVLAGLAGLMESRLSFRQLPTPAVTHLYGVNLHVLLALLVTLGARLVFWRMDDKRFPPVAAACTILAELGITASYWFLKSSWAPPFYSPGGKLFAAAVLAAAGSAGVFLVWLAARRFKSSFWARLSRGRPAAVGFVFLGAFLICNGVLAVRYAPWPRGGPGLAQQTAGPRPDVFLILVDTLRRDHLSFFGYHRPTSPNIDALFADGYVFDQAYSPGNKTVPSVVSYFTCRYPTSHGVINPFQRIPEELPALAGHFRDRGYKTAAFVANQLVTAKTGYARGFDAFVPPGMPWWWHRGGTAVENLLTLRRVPLESNRGSWINREFFRWLDDNRDGPRFVYIHYMEPHSFYEPPQRDYEAVAGDLPRGPLSPPLFHEYSSDEACIDWECLPSPPVLSERDLTGMIACYDGEIHLVDRYVGRVIDELKVRGLYDNSHVVFFTDHGEEFADHGGWFHGRSIYDEMTRCPLAYRPPGGVPGGAVISRPVPVIDLLESLVRLLGFESMPGSQGAVIPELLEINSPVNLTPVTSARPPHLYSLRLGPWKLVRRGLPSAPQDRLYDMESDPGEKVDLAASLPDTLAALRGHLDALLTLRSRGAPGKQERPMDSQTLKRLRSLGYVQ